MSVHVDKCKIKPNFSNIIWPLLLAQAREQKRRPKTTATEQSSNWTLPFFYSIKPDNHHHFPFLLLVDVECSDPRLQSPSRMAGLYSCQLSPGTFTENKMWWNSSTENNREVVSFDMFIMFQIFQYQLWILSFLFIYLHFDDAHLWWASRCMTNTQIPGVNRSLPRFV